MVRRLAAGAKGIRTHGPTVERNETCQGCTMALAREHLSLSQFEFRKEPKFDAGRSAEGPTEPRCDADALQPKERER